VGQKVGKTGALGSEKWGKWQGGQEHLGSEEWGRRQGGQDHVGSEEWGRRQGGQADSVVRSGVEGREDRSFR
jgi:hypothetical protein